MSRFDATSEFEKDFKRLFKKYKSLDDDLEKFKRILLTFPLGVGKSFVILHSSSTLQIVKARLACRALHDRALRVVYSYHEQDKLIRFVELYFKGDKESEDRERIKKYLTLHKILSDH